MQKYIQITKQNYHMFKSLPFNRDIQKIKNLKQSMLLHGFVGTVLIIKTNVLSKDGKHYFYIADGHHRVAAAMALGIPIDAMVQSNKYISVIDLIDFVSSLNNTQKPWSVIDYIKAWDYAGFPEYKKLIKYKNKYGYSYLTTACILYGVRTSGAVKSKIESGQFICNLPEQAEMIFELAGKLSQAYGKPLCERELKALDLIVALNNKKFNEKKLIKNYSNWRDNYRLRSVSDADDMFQEMLSN